MSAPQETTFTAASSDVTGWSTIRSAVGDAFSASPAVEHQVCAFFAHCTATGANGVMGVALVETTATTHKVIGYYTASLAVTARRTNLANSAANNYVINVKFDLDQSHKLDMLGHGEPVRGSTGDTRTGGARLEWRYGVTDAGGLSTITIIACPTRVT